jgi:putative ABC transport system permease protein
MHHPPKLFLRFFRWYCHPALKDHIEGDLMELHRERLNVSGKRNADLAFVVDVLLLFRPGILRPMKNSPSHMYRLAMFQNHSKIALRSLWKNKISSTINIAGLTIGLCSCLLIALFIQHETSFDTFQPNGNRITRVIMEYSFNGSTDTRRGSYTSTKVAPVFARTFPEVERSTRMADRDIIVKLNDDPVTEPYFMFADSSFFKVFAFEFLEGNPDKALNGPYKVVLTESASTKYFGKESPIGKLLLIGEEEQPYEITGLMKDYPSNSQIKFDFLASFSSLGVNQEEHYWDASYTTYLLLRDQKAMGPLQKKIDLFMKKETAGSGATINFTLEAFDKVHLYSEFSSFVPNTSISYIYILSAVAGLILLIVCFTYVNLTTARSIERAKEVGIRKSVGAGKRQLFWQFIGESFIICFFSVVLSLALSMAILPYFNYLTEKDLHFESLLTPSLIMFALAVTLSVSLVAGSYPAMILSGLQPVRVLKGIFRSSNSGKWMQGSLIVFQFAISVFLIVSTVIIQQQLFFIQHKNLGYERDHSLVVPLILPPDQKFEKQMLLRNELKSDKNVIAVSRCRSTPVQISSGHVMRTPSMPENEQIGVVASQIDDEYVKATGMQLIAGEDISEQDMKDVMDADYKKRTYHFIVNESAAKQLGWSAEEAIGKELLIGERTGFIEGVVRDFHFESMHNQIKPLVLFTELGKTGQLLIKIRGNQIPETISAMETKWKQVVPYMPFEYRFLDDDYSRLYASELHLGSIMSVFSGMAILLACLGLFGLSAFVVRQRMKEISIRKVLGASLSSIVGVLSGNFTRLVLLAIAVAVPLAYYSMDQWLQDFSYRVEMEWWIFVVAGIAAVAIAWITVSIQSLKAGIDNPVKHLKSE